VLTATSNSREDRGNATSCKDVFTSSIFVYVTAGYTEICKFVGTILVA